MSTTNNSALALWLPRTFVVACALFGATMIACDDGEPPVDAGISIDALKQIRPLDAGLKRPPNKAKRSKLTSGDPYELDKRASTKGRTLREGGHFDFRDASSNPPRALVGLSPQADHGADRVVLVDLESGDTMAEVRRARHLCEDAGVVRAWVDEPLTPAIIRLSDGGVVRPEPALADGTPLVGAKTTLVALEESSHVLVFTTDDEGDSYYGHWSDLEQALVRLDRRSPFRVQSYSFDVSSGAFDVVHGFGSPASHGRGEGDCVRARTPARGEPVCRAYGMRSRRAPSDRDQTWLGGDWATEGSAGFTMAHNTRTGARQWVAPPECRANLVAALAMPPRVLTLCEGDQNPRRYSIWRPGASVLFEGEVQDRSTFHTIGRIRYPIIPASSIELSLESSSFWVDLQHGAVVETSQLKTLRSGSQPRVTLAVADSSGDDGPRRLELVELDFDALRQRTVATYDECQGDLRLLVEPQGRRFAITCVRQPTEDFVFELQWSEVLDLEQGKRWRTDFMIESLLADGRVIASNRQRETAEGAVTSSELFLLELQ